ncbi:TRAF2 and NCK-interacting protein kinase-like [Haliotis rubra]|uniref:TRAF2 and NCK-interacting protein kinase-like n=1 Tax=Haliotis rubra TaxID=36100 RepID=UPI001EE61B21|nr:TRAF2 and NCK-interacting protein kinase-like [Haliotis rubra]
MALCTEGRLKQRKLLSPILEAKNETSYMSSPRSTELHQHLLAQYMDLKSQVGDMEESLLDHLLQENENLRQVNEQQSRELRREQELRRKAEKERAEFRVEYLNFKLSLTMEHAELQELKQTLEELTNSWENEKQAEAEQKKKLEQELKQLKSIRRQALSLTCQTPVKAQASLPVVAPPAHPKKAQRPYTGKTKSRVPAKIQPAQKNRNTPSACGDSMMKTKGDRKIKATSGKELRTKDINRGQNVSQQSLRYSRRLRQMD